MMATHDTHDKWSSVYNITLFNTLPSCAQPCLSNVDASLKCWSFGCVCSESTPGNNFLTGASNINACVQKACSLSNDTAVNLTLTVYSSICNVQPYFLNSSGLASA